MTLRCHHRFADDVGQIGADSKIPVYAGEAQRWSGNKTSAHAEEPTETADDEADHDETDRINVRPGDRERHYSERPRRRGRTRPDVAASRTHAAPISARMAQTAEARS